MSRTLDELHILTDSRTDTASDDTTGVEAGPVLRSMQEYKCVLNVSALDVADTDETYTFKVQVSTDDATYADAGNVVALDQNSVAGRYEILLSGGLVELADATSIYARINLVVAGTTPSITWAAHLEPADVAV